MISTVKTIDAFSENPESRTSLRVTGASEKVRQDSHAAATARKPGLSPSTRRRGSRRNRKASNSPTHSRPEFGAKNIAKRLRGAALGDSTPGPQPAPGGLARGSHARRSPVFWRQTRCEKERSAGLQRLYMALPHPRGKGRSQHTTRLSQFTPRHLHRAPVQSPSPPPTFRGPWAMCAQPTKEPSSPRACSSLPQ